MLVNRQLKHNTISKVYCQAFFFNFLNFFKIFQLFLFLTKIFVFIHAILRTRILYYIMSRESCFYHFLKNWVSHSYHKKKSLAIPFGFTRVIFFYCHRLTASAAGLAISRTFFTRLPRGRIHGTRIIPFRRPAAVRTRHFIRVYFHQLVKAFSAIFAFVL